VANIVFNVARGRAVEFYNRIVSNDPANSAFVLVPIETTGLEADAVLIDKDDLAAVLSGATNEQTTMGRKTLTNTELVALPAPVDASDQYDVALPTVTWSAATGNAISKMLVCYDSDTTAGTDANILPVTMFDFAITPDGSDIQMTLGTFFRAG
jgi:hypothetical protein